VRNSDAQIVIENNDHLESVAALSGIDFARHVSVSNNPELLTLGGLDGLRTADDVVVTANPKLTRIDLGLTTARSLLVLGNPALASVTLGGLTAVQRDATIVANDTLPRVDAPLLSLIGGTLTVSSNASFTTLRGLDSVTSVAAMLISGNPMLPQCEVDALGARLNACQSNCLGNDDTATCP
jgi:hypothetical protein